MGENDKPAVESIKFGNGNSEKCAILTDLAKKISALDNPVKLNILSLLVESGSLSITDIAKKLDLNFSTAHKYLEQLEAASLVKSKQVAENRLKRVFTIQNFTIELSPKSLFQKSSDASNGKGKPKFRLFDSYGQLVDFDEEKFAQKYIKRGMPRGTYLLALQEVLPQVYDGITLFELQQLFKQIVENKAENVRTTFKQIDDDTRHKRTFTHLFSVVRPEALQLHATGDIFIKNLHEPKLLNFVQDLIGLSENGVSGHRAANAQEFLNQLQSIIEQSCHFTMGSQTLHNFSSVVSKLNNINGKILEDFLDKLELKNIRILIEIDSENPELVSLLEKKQYKNVIPYISYSNRKFLGKHKLGEFYIINCKKYCTLVEHAAIDSKWRGEKGVKRVGEVQEIVINSLKLALSSATKGEFFEKLKELVKLCVEFNKNAFELVLGTFYRKYPIYEASEKKSQSSWTYAVPHDFMYTISLSNLGEVAAKLGITNSEFTKFLNNLDSAYIRPKGKSGIRLAMKVNNDLAISERFKKLSKVQITEQKPDLSLPMICFKKMTLSDIAKEKPKENEVWHVYS